MEQLSPERLYPPTQRWPWLPRGIDAWFSHSCAREPKERFASIGQQVEALGAVFGTPAGPVLNRESSLPANAPAPLVVAAVTAPAPPGASTTAATAGNVTGPAKAGNRGPLITVVATVLVAAAAGSVLLVRGRGSAQQDTEAATAPPASISTAAEPSTPMPALVATAPVPESSVGPAPATPPAATAADPAPPQSQPPNHPQPPVLGPAEQPPGQPAPPG